MAYYFIANIKIHDAGEYQKYIEKAGEIFSKFNGKYLAVDNSPKLIEGNWDCTRTVIISFASQKDFEEWYYSNEYQEILQHRLEGANCDTILVEGKKTGNE